MENMSATGRTREQTVAALQNFQGKATRKLDSLMTNLAFKEQFAKLDQEKRHLDHTFSFLGKDYFNNPNAYEEVKTAAQPSLEHMGLPEKFKELSKKLNENPDNEEIRCAMEDILTQLNTHEPDVEALKKFEDATNYESQKKEIEQREAALKSYIESTPLNKKSKAGMIWRATAAKMNPLRGFFMGSFIHPATKAFTPKALERNPERLQAVETNKKIMDEWAESGHLERIKLYTPDHHQIEGCIIKAPSSYDGSSNFKDRPTMVMVSGNYSSMETTFYLASEYAEKHDINVLIYNPRGVGGSLGKEHSTQEAVVDCQTALRYALNELCSGNPDKLAVYGHSLGGGITATALRKMVKREEIPDGVGLYVNSHSFTSLHGVLKGELGAVTQNPKTLQKGEKVFRQAIKFIGINALDTEKAIKKGIAKTVIVHTAGQDDVIKEHARLGPVLTTNDKIRVMTHDRLTHDEDYEYFETHTEYNDLIAQWAHPPQ